MNSDDSETDDAHRLVWNLRAKIDIRKLEKRISLSDLRKFHTWRYIKKDFKSNRFKISGPN